LAVRLWDDAGRVNEIVNICDGINATRLYRDEILLEVMRDPGEDYDFG
jgi:hypothetical protein